MRKLRLRDTKEHMTTKWHDPKGSNLKTHALSPHRKLGLRAPPLPAPLRPHPILHSLSILHKGGPGAREAISQGTREGTQVDVLLPEAGPGHMSPTPISL